MSNPVEKFCKTLGKLQLNMLRIVELLERRPELVTELSPDFRADFVIAYGVIEKLHDLVHGRTPPPRRRKYDGPVIEHQLNPWD